MAAPKKIDPKEIERLYKDDVPIVRIARKLKCNPSTVDYHIDRMGIRGCNSKGGAK